MKLWQKKDTKVLDIVEEFEVGKDYIYDREIAVYDIKGTIAHVKMLNKIGILTDEETRKVILELDHLYDEFKKQPPELKIEDEDIHTFIENYLVSTIGEVGKKIHTGRSRNDQVLTAIRLYEKDKILEITEQIDIMLKKLINLSKKFKDKPLIGYTHFRQAMPTTVDMWIESFIEAIEDDRKLLKTSYEFIDRNPLGSSAGYGFPKKLDREYTTHLLEFSSFIKNPIYCQNTRGKYESILLFAITTLAGDIARLANDIIVFSSDEFGFIKLREEITTGSSIMPHKKNPDIFELIRAKFKKFLGHLVSMMGITFSINSGYSKDLQETKELTIESIKEITKILEVINKTLDYIDFDETAVFSKMQKKIFSVDIAVIVMDEFKLPFRDAYRKVGEIINEYENNKDIIQLTEKFQDEISKRIIELLSLDVVELFNLCLERRK